MHKDLAMVQYKDSYDNLVASGVLKETIVGGEVYVSNRRLSAGQEWGTDSGSSVSRQKKITAEEHKEAVALLKSLKWEFDTKPSEAGMVGQHLPQKVTDKMEAAVRVMQKSEKDAKQAMLVAGDEYDGNT